MITKKDGVFFYYIADYFRSEHKLQVELIFLLPMFQMFPNNYANISSLGNLRFSDKHRKREKCTFSRCVRHEIW